MVESTDCHPKTTTVIANKPTIEIVMANARKWANPIWTAVLDVSEFTSNRRKIAGGKSAEISEFAGAKE